MNELERRIHRDATKTAAEITPADIPALRLTRGRLGAQRRAQAGHSHGTTPWSGIAPGHPGRRVAAALAAAASIAAVASALVIVGHGSAASSGTTGTTGTGTATTTAAPTRHGPTAADRLLGTEALDWYFPASGASYTAGLAFAWTQDKITARDIDPCLAGAGFPQPPFHGSRQLYQMSFPSNQFPDLTELAAHPGVHVFTGQYPVVHNPTSARMKRFDHAQARCTARLAGSVTRVDKAANHLESAWMRIVAAIELSPKVKATAPALTKCLEAHGVPASFATMPTSASNPLFAGWGAWSDSLIQNAGSKHELAADQRKVARVFLSCAGPVATVLDRLQTHQRTQFFSAHDPQIARIAKLAQDMG